MQRSLPQFYGCAAPVHFKRWSGWEPQGVRGCRRWGRVASNSRNCCSQKRLAAKHASQAENEVNFVPACQQDLSDNIEVIPPKWRDISISLGLEPSYFEFSTRVRSEGIDKSFLSGFYCYCFLLAVDFCYVSTYRPAWSAERSRSVLTDCHCLFLLDGSWMVMRATTA